MARVKVKDGPGRPRIGSAVQAFIPDEQRAWLESLGKVSQVVREIIDNAYQRDGLPPLEIPQKKK